MSKVTTFLYCEEMDLEILRNIRERYKVRNYSQAFHLLIKEYLGLARTIQKMKTDNELKNPAPEEKRQKVNPFTNP